MPSGIRAIHLVLGGLCLALGIVVALELVLPIVDDVTASPTDGRAAVADPPPVPTIAAVDSQALVDQILERPLFSSDRKPPAPKPSADDSQAPAAPTPPPLPDRLAGVMVGPDVRAAVFGNPGEKETTVELGGNIGGWTVSSIEFDRVVLTSTFGEHVFQPTPGVRVDLGNRARPAVPVRRPVTPTAQTVARPPNTVPIPPRLQTPTIVPNANRRVSPHP